MRIRDKEKAREYGKTWREKHKEAISEKKRLEYLKNREIILARQKAKYNPKFPGKSQSEIAKEAWKNPEYKEMMRQKQIGKKHTEEHKRKIGLKSLGNKHSLGIKRSMESIAKGSKTRKDRKIPGCWKGKKRSILCPLSDETKKRMSELFKGEKGSNWKGGVTHIHKILRNSAEFKDWREAVFERDDWTCQKCNVRGGSLHPHHILNFSQYPDMRFSLDNGVTLCEKDHREFHKRYGQEYNTKEQLNEYLNSEENIHGVAI